MEMTRMTDVDNLVSGLNTKSQYVFKQVGELESHQFYAMHNQEDEQFDEYFVRRLLEVGLQELYVSTTFALEALGLHRTREQLVVSWKRVEGALRETSWIHEVDALESEPLTLLLNYVDSIRMLSSSATSPVEVSELERLENMLRDTAVLVARRRIVPRREADVQLVMHDYLRAAFVDFSPKPHVAGNVKNFNPDGGVRSLNAAMEFKFADSEADLKARISEIFEDMGGYSGSKDWTRFYAVIYMTGPFESEARFRDDIRRTGSTQWKVILVNGSGSRAQKARRPKMETSPPDTAVDSSATTTDAEGVAAQVG